MRIFSSLNIAALAVIISVFMVLKHNPEWEKARQEREAEKEVVVEDPLARYEAVDLGLSVKWSSADYIYDDRIWFHWEEGWVNTIYADQTKDFTLKDDIVYERLNQKWRVPSPAEIKELAEKCTWTQVVELNKKGKVKLKKGAPILVGYKVVGPNGNSIFIDTTDGEIEYFTFSRSAKLCVDASLDAEGHFIVDGNPKLSILSFRGHNTVLGRIRPVLVK